MKKTTVLVQGILVAALLTTSFAHSQTAPSADPLFKAIQSLDTQLFDAYNHCDLEKFGSLLSSTTTSAMSSPPDSKKSTCHCGSPSDPIRVRTRTRCARRARPLPTESVAMAATRREKSTKPGGGFASDGGTDRW